MFTAKCRRSCFRFHYSPNPKLPRLPVTLLYSAGSRRPVREYILRLRLLEFWRSCDRQQSTYSNQPTGSHSGIRIFVDENHAPSPPVPLVGIAEERDGGDQRKADEVVGADGGTVH